MSHSFHERARNLRARVQLWDKGRPVRPFWAVLGGHNNFFQPCPARMFADSRRQGVKKPRTQTEAWVLRKTW